MERVNVERVEVQRPQNMGVEVQWEDGERWKLSGWMASG